jgi:hypothetical protein
MFPEMLDFILKLLIAGFVLRCLQMYAIGKDSALGKALAFIY